MYRIGLWVALAIVVPIAAAVALVPGRDQMTSANLALVMLVGAVVIAGLGNRVSIAVVCAAVTGLAYDFFLVRPYYSVTIAKPAEALTAVLVLVVVAVVGSVSSLVRRQRSIIERREDNLGLLYHLVERVANTAGEESLIETGEREIGELLSGASCRYAKDQVTTNESAYIDPIGDIHIDGHVWDAEHQGLPDQQLALPVQSGGLQFGSFLVVPVAGTTVARWELIVTVMIADLVGAALARWPTGLE